MISSNNTAVASRHRILNHFGASLFRAAYYQLIPTILQQLNSAEWPEFCDNSVTSADVRLASAWKLSI